VNAFSSPQYLGMTQAQGRTGTSTTHGEDRDIHHSQRTGTSTTHGGPGRRGPEGEDRDIHHSRRRGPGRGPGHPQLSGEDRDSHHSVDCLPAKRSF
jgi:hypothetical protein